MSSRNHDEVGATLMLAMAYVILVGVVVGALGSWIVNDLNNAKSFAAASSRQLAASSAVTLALQSIRYVPLLGTGQTLNATPPSYCWGNSAPSGFTSADGTVINVWCSTSWTSTSSATRVVTISACASTVSAAACAGSPLLQTVVTYDDYQATGMVPTTTLCTTTCGAAMTVNSWTWAGRS
jgi:hypothetical protein